MIKETDSQLFCNETMSICLLLQLAQRAIAVCAIVSYFNGLFFEILLVKVTGYEDIF